MELSIRDAAKAPAPMTLWYGPDLVVHLFAAIPNSVATELGRLLLPKADPTIQVYDRQPSGFVLRGTLN